MSKNQKTGSPKQKDWQNKIFLYQKTRCSTLATKFLKSYRHMVGAAARRLSRNCPDMYDDLYQIGQLSLLRSLERYDHSYGSSFESYARKNMKGYMMNYLRDKAWNIPMPRWMKEKWSLVQKAKDELTVKMEREPTISDISKHCNLSYEMTEQILSGQARFLVTSLDADLRNNEGEEYTMSDLIGYESKDYELIESHLDLRKAWSGLNKKEKRILHLNFFRGESQRSIARKLGISQMTVSRMLNRALEKMKNCMQQPIHSI